MKKINVLGLCLGLLLSGTPAVHGQLKVSKDGKVGIQVGTETPQAALSIGGSGSENTSVMIITKERGLHVTNEEYPSENEALGILSDIGSTLRNCTGIESYSTTTGDNVFTYGVKSFSLAYGNIGSCYGVAGIVRKNSKVGTAAIMGTLNETGQLSIPGNYAGYFDGNVGVTGTINGIVLGNSDARYKKNIKGLEQKRHKTLQDVISLSPVEYNLNQVYIESKAPDMQENRPGVKNRPGSKAIHAAPGEIIQHPIYDEQSQLFQKKHYGLIAQDLQKLYPDLVYEQDNGYLAINYTGLIPLLIQSIKELKEEIDERNAPAPALGAAAAIGAAAGDTPASLAQNAPNPFSTETRIRFHLPPSVTTASLCIYDLQGKQLKKINIGERGAGSVQLSGSEFAPGIYLYGLIADGAEVDIKRMILTE